MTTFPEMIQQGTAHAWLFVPSAILLGALHGLEPGHSKTMMAAFIIAIQGTVSQAVLLGLSATLSHTAVVWTVALAGQYLGNRWGSEAIEPYFQLASAVIIVGIAVWMLWRTWHEREVALRHDHGEESRQIATKGGLLVLQVFEDGVPPRWRIRPETGAQPVAQDYTLETVRDDGKRQIFGFVAGSGYLESCDKFRSRMPSGSCCGWRTRVRLKSTRPSLRNTTTWTSEMKMTPMRANMPRRFGAGLRVAR